LTFVGQGHRSPEQRYTPQRLWWRATTAEFKLDERTTFLRWAETMDGHKSESLEVIVDNEQGLIVERTITLRPYPALKLFRDAMYASLKDWLPPDVWDYPTP